MLKTKNYIKNIDYLWILLDGKVEIKKNESTCDMHCDYWGEEVWDNPNRGYFEEKTNTVTIHASEKIGRDTVKKIARAFEKEGLIAIYLKGNFDEF